MILGRNNKQLDRLTAYPIEGVIMGFSVVCVPIQSLNEIVKPTYLVLKPSVFACVCVS